MNVLLSVLILVIIVIVALYIIDLLPLPHPVPLIAKVVVGLIALIKIFEMLGGLGVIGN